MAKGTRKENGQGTIRRLANGKYQCSIETKDKLGNRKLITATADKERIAREKAQSKLEQYKAFLSEGKVGDEELAHRTLEEVMSGKWFDDYAKNRWTSRTKNSRKADLAILYRQIGAMRLDKVSTTTINDFFADALTPTNRQRLGMVFSITNDFFTDMYDRGVIEKNPFGRGIKKLPSPQKSHKEEYTLEEIEEADFEETNVKFFLDSEVMKLKEALTFIDLHGKPLYPRAPIYYLMFLTGMRGQEIRALNVSDIDFENHTIRINKALSTATKKDGKEHMVLKRPKTSSSIRKIGINAETENLLKRIISERANKECPILYCTKTGNWVSKDNFARDFSKLLKNLDIPQNGRGPHCLRHTFASFALEGNELSPLKNQKPLFISSYLGHRDLSITYRIYTHLDKEKLQNIQLEEPENIMEIEWKD